MASPIDYKPTDSSPKKKKKKIEQRLNPYRYKSEITKGFIKKKKRKKEKETTKGLKQT